MSVDVAKWADHAAGTFDLTIGQVSSNLAESLINCIDLEVMLDCVMDWAFLCWLLTSAAAPLARWERAKNATTPLAH